MKKISSIIIFLFFCLSLPKGALALTNDDTGIQKVFFNVTPPHLNSSGQVQNVYNNSSFFPLALYYVDNTTLQEVKNAGFNTIFPAHEQGIGAQNINLLEQYGLKGFPNLEGIVKNTPDSTRQQAVASYVNSIKNSPAVLAWHLFDETATVDGLDEAGSMAIWQQAYNTIHQNDPSGRAVFANRIGGCDATIRDFCNGDLYSIDNNTSSLYAVGRSIDNMVNTGKPAFIVLQAFAGDGWHMPTPVQIRGQMYAAVVHGATGLWLFVQQSALLPGKLDGISQNHNPAHWQAASIANHEIETYKKVYFSKTSSDEYHVSVDHLFSGGQSPIHTILKDPGEGETRYLLAVNMTSDQTQSQFSFAKNYVSVTSLLDNRTVSLTDNSFIDSFGGYGVRLYKLSTTSSPGDLNGDGYVDILDLRQAFSGAINIFNYNLVVGNFGQPSP